MPHSKPLITPKPRMPVQAMREQAHSTQHSRAIPLSRGKTTPTVKASHGCMCASNPTPAGDGVVTAGFSGRPPQLMGFRPSRRPSFHKGPGEDTGIPAKHSSNMCTYNTQRDTQKTYESV